MASQYYSSKPDAYFSNARTEIQSLLPNCADRVLEVGCGSGATLRWMKETGRCKHAVGLELFEDAAQEARKYVDDVVCGNAEAIIATAFECNHFDVILCLDVLEHMVDPWQFVDRAAMLLKPGGTLIASVPNVRHLAVVLPLVFGGRWRYGPKGVLDRTHLRFFTREGAIALLGRTPLGVDRWMRNMPPNPSKSRLLNQVTLGLLKDFLALQYLVSATRND